MSDENEEPEAGDEIYSGSSSSSSSGSNLPLLQNSSVSMALWVNKDKNGDFYLTWDNPLFRNIPIFVTDRFQDAFNQMIEHLIEEGKLSESAMGRDSNE